MQGSISAETERAQGAETALDGRIDTLEETVENVAYLGENDGNAVVADFDPQTDTVWKKVQTLSAAEKEQIQHNIGIREWLNTLTGEKFASVTATAQTTSVTQVLPATGEADTVYRVGKWDGAAFNEEYYSDYAWDGSTYVQLNKKSIVGEVFDISEYHGSAKYADLTAALDGGNNIPVGVRKGGMSVKFVQSSDNMYVQYFLTKDEWSTSEADWEKMNLEEEFSQLGQKADQLDAEINASKIPLTDYLDGRYIGVGGAINSSAPFKVYYFQCVSGDKLNLSYEIFDNSTARAYAVYSSDDIANAGPDTLVELGPIGQGEHNYNIEITSSSAKLLCLTTKGDNSAWKAVLRKFDGKNNFEHVIDDLTSIIGAQRLPLSTNPLRLETYPTKTAARQATYPMRRAGMKITYRLDSGEIVTETFTAADQNKWLNPIYWQPEGMQHIFKKGYYPTNTIEKYISCVKCNEIGLELAMSLSVTSAPVTGGVSLEITSCRIYQKKNGTWQSWSNQLANVSLDSFSSEEEHAFNLVRRNSNAPNIAMVLRVKDMFDDAIQSFSIGSSSSPINYVFEKNLSDSYCINEGVAFPFTNVNSTEIITESSNTAITNYLKAILDIEIYGANDADGYVYQIYLLSKERVANNWGNGVRLRKLSATDYSVIETADFRSPSASADVKKELDKIAGTEPLWMQLKAFGLTFRILVNGTYLESGASGEWAVTGYMGTQYYISPKTYRPAQPSGVKNYSTLKSAVVDSAQGMFSIGQNIVVGLGNVTYSSDDLRPMCEKYKATSPNPVFPMVKKATLQRLYDSDSNVLYLCSSSDSRLFYTICPTDTKHNDYTSKSQYAVNYFFFASKSAPTTLTKVVLPDYLPGGASNIVGRKKFVFEMSNGDILLEVENGDALTGATSKNNIYKITGLFNITPIDGIITVPSANISLSLSFEWNNSRICAFMQSVEANPSEIVLAPYGTGKTAIIYHSTDYGDNWEAIFCGNVDNETVNIIPKAEYEGTSTAFGEWPTADSVISSTPLDWSGTGNNNIHIHGIAYDRWMNRLWVCTGDGSGYPNGVTGIWWTDDWGRTWHRIATRNTTVMDGFDTQLMFPVPLEHSVLFATDGNGDGCLRWSRTTKQDDVVIEPAYNFLGTRTALVMVAGRWARFRNFSLISFAPDSAEQGDWKNRGGIVATHNGFDFFKIYEDEFTDTTGTDEHAFDTAEIGWSCEIADCEDKIVLKADKGGIIILDLLT